MDDWDDDEAMCRPGTIPALRRAHPMRLPARGWEWKLPALMADGASEPGNGWRATWPDAEENGVEGMCIVHITRMIRDKAKLMDEANREVVKNDVLLLSENIWHPDLVPIAYEVSSR